MSPVPYFVRQQAYYIRQIRSSSYISVLIKVTGKKSQNAQRHKSVPQHNTTFLLTEIITSQILLKFFYINGNHIFFLLNVTNKFSFFITQDPLKQNSVIQKQNKRIPLQTCYKLDSVQVMESPAAEQEPERIVEKNMLPAVVLVVAVLHSCGYQTQHNCRSFSHKTMQDTSSRRKQILQLLEFYTGTKRKGKAVL